MTTLKNYTDPAIVVKFFHDFGIEPQQYPDGLKTVMVNAGFYLEASTEQQGEWEFNADYPNTMEGFRGWLAHLSFEGVASVPNYANTSEDMKKLIEVVKLMKYDFLVEIRSKYELLNIELCYDWIEAVGL
jgi:hypothetical protein